MEKLSNYHNEERPWGSFERFTLNETSTVKIITVSAGEAFSLQTHQNRDEYWRILSGDGEVVLRDERLKANTGDSFFVPRNTLHRMYGGQRGVTFLEIALGNFNETDIERLDDRYGRTT